MLPALNDMVTANSYLNGCDFLMLAFDRELRRAGYAGNSCQIVLELETVVSSSALEERVNRLIADRPIFRSRSGGVIWPRWRALASGRGAVLARTHKEEALIEQRLFNEPLNAAAGELLRFDLVERKGRGPKLVFTWAHALMDATGAEEFLSTVGNPEAALPALDAPATNHVLPLKERFSRAWKYIDHLDEFCKAPPRCLGARHPQAPAALGYRVEKFSVEETALVRKNAASLCGVLGETQYHVAAAVVELDRLHRRLGCPSPSYVLPIAIGLRRKGSIEPLLGNQLTMLMYQFLPNQLECVADAAAILKNQATTAMRSGLLENGRVLSELFRFLPVPVYLALVKQGLRGEICSLFYGDTATVNPKLSTFLGSRVEDFTHVAAVTPSPGVGLIFYYFREELRVTVLHAEKVLNSAEVEEFGQAVRERLIKPA